MDASQITNFREFRLTDKTNIKLDEIPAMSNQTRAVVRDLGNQVFNAPKPSADIENYISRVQKLEDCVEFGGACSFALAALGIALLVIPMIIGIAGGPLFMTLLPLMIISIASGVCSIIGSIGVECEEQEYIENEKKSLEDLKKNVTDFLTQFYINFEANKGKLKELLNAELGKLYPLLQDSNFVEANGKKYVQFQDALNEVEQLEAVCNRIQEALSKAHSQAPAQPQQTQFTQATYCPVIAPQLYPSLAGSQ